MFLNENNIISKYNDIKRLLNEHYYDDDDELRWSKLIDFDGSSVDTIILRGRTFKTALFVSVEKENIDIIKLLLTYEDIDVNSCGDERNGTWGGTSIMFSHNSNNKSPLFVAIEKENLEIIKLLLTNKEIDVNIGGNDKSSTDGGDEVSWEGSPLQKAVEIENIEIIKLLYSNDQINPNITMRLYADWQGGGEEGEGTTVKSVLYTALQIENIEIIKFLLVDDKINVNFLNYNYNEVDDEYFWKETALHFAVVHYENNKDIIRLLTNHKNIDLNIENHDGKKPIDCCNGDDDELIQMLSK